MEKINIETQTIACFTLHIAGQSNKLIFKNINVIEYYDFIKIGKTLYGHKFINMMANAKELLKKHTENRISVITIIEKGYPVLLKKTMNPPLALFYIGNLQLLENPIISIVGTRKPSIITIHWLKEICKFLSEQGFTLISGLAKGVDTIVHNNSFLKGTVGIAAQSLDIKSPTNNAYLFDLAFQRNTKVLIISEYPLTTLARKYHFIHRNRIIAGISATTIFAEGGMNSGAMITANWCLKQERQLFVIHSIFQKNKDGNDYLLETRQAKIINDSFPIDIISKNFEKTDNLFMLNSPRYLGDNKWVIINSKNFSTKSLLSDQQGQDFV